MMEERMWTTDDRRTRSGDDVITGAIKQAMVVQEGPTHNAIQIFVEKK